MNQFQLPVEKSHGTCLVRVKMREGLEYDEGTWLGVSLAATQLNIVCVGTSLFTANQGGNTTAGLYDGILISLTYLAPEISLQLEGNGTAGMNETVVGDITSTS